MKAALLLALLLTGCATVVPVTQPWPEAPGLQSTTPCPQLQLLKQGAQLSDVARVITVNYTEYYQCAVKLDAWIEWYEKQQIIYKGLK